MNLLFLLEKLSCHAIYEICFKLQMVICYTMKFWCMHDKFEKTKCYKNNDVYKKFWEDVDKSSYIMPYDISKEI
jgi:hypothetical protein